MEAALESNPFKGKKRENPFYDFENISRLKDCVIVTMKAWTAKKKKIFDYKSSTQVLVAFINENVDFFKLKIEAIA